MEIEHPSSLYSQGKQPHIVLKDKLTAFSKEFDNFKLTVETKYEEFKSMHISSFTDPSLKESDTVHKSMAQDHSKNEDMGIESTGVSLGTPKDTVNKKETEVSISILILKIFGD